MGIPHEKSNSTARFGLGLVVVCLLLGVLLLWQLIIFNGGVRVLRAYSEIPDAPWGYAIGGTLLAGANFLLLGLAIFWLTAKRQPASVWLTVAAIWFTLISTRIAHRPPSYPEVTTFHKVEIGLEWLIYVFATLYLLSSERVATLYNSAKLPLFSPREVVATLRGRK